MSDTADNKIVELNSKFVEMFNNGSDVQLRELICETLKLDRENPITLTNYGAFLCNYGNYTQALIFLRQAELIAGYQDYNLFFNIGVTLVNISGEARPFAQIYFDKANGLNKSPYTVEAYIDFTEY